MRLLFGCALLCIVSFNSCQKKENIPVHSHQMVPAPVVNMADVTDYLRVPALNNTWGVFVAATLRGTFKDSTGTIQLYSNDASAYFMGNDDTTRTAGKVTINDAVLDTTIIYNPYCKYYYNSGNVPLNSLNFETDNRWSVSGNSYVPAISYNYAGAFPAYSGIIQDSISASGDFQMHFDASNCSNADSAFVRISVADYLQRNIYSSVVSASCGVININNFEIQNIVEAAAQFPGNIYLEVYLFKYDTKTFGNKRFVFMKINENIHNIFIKP